MENEVKNGTLEDIEPLSKSQLKRESHEIQKLGKRLVGLPVELLGNIPLDEPVLEAISLARKIQNERAALKRHYQFLGKLLRARDTSSILAALELIDQSSHVGIKRHHQAEYWRDEIITRGIEAIESLLTKQASADRQKLRQLWRNHSNAKTDARKTQISRLIYQEVMQAL
jgi:ribosome-associated protein